MSIEWDRLCFRKTRQETSQCCTSSVARVSLSSSCSHSFRSLMPADNTFLRRVSRLENQFMVMQSQIIGIQSTLDQILNAVKGPPAAQPHVEKAPSASRFPPLPGFAPPPHKYATYGIIPSTAASSDDESEDTLPRSSINAPIEALQGLANAAAEAASASGEPRSVDFLFITGCLSSIVGSRNERSSQFREMHFLTLLKR